MTVLRYCCVMTRAPRRSYQNQVNERRIIHRYALYPAELFFVSRKQPSYTPLHLIHRVFISFYRVLGDIELHLNNYEAHIKIILKVAICLLN